MDAGEAYSLEALRIISPRRPPPPCSSGCSRSPCTLTICRDCELTSSKYDSAHGVVS